MDSKARLYSYYGGKARLTKEICELLPEKFDTYVEPFFGSGSVFFALEQDRYKKAVVNDIEEGIIHFLRTLVGEEGEELVRQLKELDPDEYEFKTAKYLERLRYVRCSPIKKAIYVYITITQSYNCLRKNFRRGMNTERYQNQIAKGLPAAREKLQGAEILQGDAYDVIMKYKDNPNAVLMIDSPYLPKTRTAPQSYYSELRESDHVRMLLAVRDAKAKCILCGYQEEHDGLYDRYLLSRPNWTAQILKEVAKPCANKRGNMGKKAEEWIWKNY